MDDGITEAPHHTVPDDSMGEDIEHPAAATDMQDSDDDESGSEMTLARQYNDVTTMVSPITFLGDFIHRVPPGSRYPPNILRVVKERDHAL